MLQFSLFFYAIGISFTMVQAQVQALEPFPTRAGTAAGLMGALRSAMTCAVAITGGAIHSHTPRPTCTAICLLGVSKLLVHLAMRPAATVRTSPTSTAEVPQGNSVLLAAAAGPRTSVSAAEVDPTLELRQAHEAARRDVTAAKAKQADAVVSAAEIVVELDVTEATGAPDRSPQVEAKPKAEQGAAGADVNDRV